MSKRLCRGGAPAATPAAKQSLQIGIALRHCIREGLNLSLKAVNFDDKLMGARLIRQSRQ